MSDRTIVFWDCDRDREELVYDSIDEAVVGHFDDREGPLPETVVVYGWARKELPSVQEIGRYVLDNVFEWLDQDYGNPNDYTPTYTPTYPPNIHDAAKQFAQKIRDNYDIYTCDQVTEQTVRVADHVPASWLAAPAPQESTE